MQTRLVFMGSPQFAVPILNTLTQSYDVVGVVTRPDRPAGRGKKTREPAIKRTAMDLGIPVVQPEKLRLPEAMRQLQAWSPDMIVVAAYGQILRQEVLDLPRFGCINVHASLLPRWRGASPIQYAILKGDKLAGVTIMKMDAGLDTGGILMQEAIPILPEDSAGSLCTKLADMGAQLLARALHGFIDGRITPVAQDESQVTYAPLLKKEEGILDFNQDVELLERKTRALDPWPGAYFVYHNDSIKVKRTQALRDASAEVARRYIIAKEPAVGAGGGFLVLKSVQPAGKRVMTGREFLMGARNWESKD
jgi:methionyl-tRNA formyltransferase